jgi:hypothetical protein
MPTKNDKSNTKNSSNTKSSGTKNSKSSASVSNAVPSTTARDKVKNMDTKRRGDTETFNL